MILVRLLNLRFLDERAARNGRNLKFAALAMLLALLAAGDEAMAEQPGRMLLQLPLRIARPQRRQLATAEACARAHHRVVNADIVAAHEPKEPARLDHELAAPRLARHHQRGH